MFRKSKSKQSYGTTPQAGRDKEESFDLNHGAAQTPSSVQTKTDTFESRTPQSKSHIKMKLSPYKPHSPKKTVDNSQSYFNETTTKNYAEIEQTQTSIVNPSTVESKMNKPYKPSGPDKSFPTPKPVVQVKAKDIPKAPAKQLIIGAGVMVKADITEADLVLIEGCVEGTINAKCIMILDGGSVLGEATCDVAYIAGIFTGPKLITAEKLQVGSTGRIKASISYNIISMDAGAVVTGMIVNCPPKVEEEKVEEKPAEEVSEIKKEDLVKEPIAESAKDSVNEPEKPVKKDDTIKKDPSKEAAVAADLAKDDAPTPLS
mmetsp:Transcript_8111/g.11414  ORF Transcript_8111/g.11414 Transcript_8111/m.11414 type:complete len:317 (-) Transcript_8111:185-1135(-)